MVIQESAENYLEAILAISQQKGAVRSIDVANRLGFSKPSISVAMKQFRENGYITMDDDGLIHLTDAGKRIAESVYERHLLLAACLMRLGVNETVAYEDACRLEHDLSPESFEAIKNYYRNNVKHEEK